MSPMHLEAHRKRTAIYDIVRDSGGCELSAVYAAMPGMDHCVVRKILRNLREWGSVVVTGTSRKPFFTATDKPPMTAAEALERNCTSLAKGREKNIEQRQVRQSQPPVDTYVTCADGRVRLVHRGENRPPIRHQGGQGSIGVQPRGICRMLGE